MTNFFKPGWRTIKTALSVFCCILLYQILNLNPAITSLSAVFALRENTSRAFSFGKSRLLSNATGGLLALTIYQIHLLFPYNWLNLILLPTAVIIFIQLMNLWHNTAGIISGLAALFVIYFTIPADKSFSYAILRTIDTFVGVFIAIIINHFIHPHKPNIEEQIKNIDQQISVLEKQKLELKQKNESF